MSEIRGGFRLTGAAGRTRNGFVWPEIGEVHAPGPFLGHKGACPLAVGDGICVALTWAGVVMTYTPTHYQRVAFDAADVLGETKDKVRVRRATVLETMPLSGADLSGTDLSDADLTGTIR